MKALTLAQWLFCVRVTVSTLIAYAITHGADPYNALYAVLGAALVTAPSFGEGLGVSRERLIGTLLGSLVSIPATWLGDPTLALGAAAIAVAPLGIVAGGLPVARVAITVAAVTCVVHSQSPEDYGLFRFTNTLAGVATSLAVGLAFWPIAGRLGYSEDLRTVVRAAVDLAARLAEHRPGDPLLADQQKLFRALSAIPRATTFAHLDPFLRRDRSRLDEETYAVAAIGVSLLSVSLTQMRLAHLLDGPARAAVQDRCRAVAQRLEAVLPGPRHATWTRSAPPAASLPAQPLPAQPLPAGPAAALARIVDHLAAIEADIDSLRNVQAAGPGR